MAKLSCFSDHDIEYYLQIYQNSLPETQELCQKMDEHFSSCFECKKKVNTFKLLYEQQMEEKTVSLKGNSSFLQKNLDKTVFQEDLHKTIFADFSGKEPPIIAGCKILQRVGGGAMGEVYKALKISLNRIVAVKIFHNENKNKDREKRFQQEAQILAQVDHPNVTQVYDYFVDPRENKCYLIMQYIEGEDLEKYINRIGPLSIPKAGTIFLQLLNGLQALHKAGIIHRDLKPSNVLIDPENHIKIADFGLAKSQKDQLHLTLHGTLIGTPHYMSPEACRGLPQTIQSDIYSLGCLFYAVLLGRTLFQGNSSVEIINQHLYSLPKYPSVLVPNFPPALEQLILKMIAKEVHQRYQSCNEVIEALQKCQIFSDFSLVYSSSSKEISQINLPNEFNLAKRIETHSSLAPFSPNYESIPFFQKIESNVQSNTGTIPFLGQKHTRRLRQILSKQGDTSLDEIICEICQQSQKITTTIVCEICKRTICSQHQFGLFCGICYHRYEFSRYLYYLSTVEELKKQHLEIPIQGKLNFANFSKLLFHLNETSSEALLLVGTENNKKGICFFENKIALLTFGEERLVKIENLLLQEGRVSQQELNDVLQTQKETQEELREIFVKKGILSESVLEEVFQKQMRKELFEFPQKEDVFFKFKEGPIAPQMLANVAKDAISFNNLQRFRNTLATLFQHLSFLFAPGIFFLHSPKGSIGFLVRQNQIDFVNFEPKLGFNLRKSFIAEGILDESTLDRIPFIDGCLLGDYLVQKKLATEFEVLQALQHYVGAEIISYLKEGNYSFEFIEGEISSEKLPYFSVLNLGIDLRKFTLNIFEKTPFLPNLDSFIKIFTIVFNKTSSLEIRQILLERIIHTLPLDHILNKFNDFESTISSLAFLKSSLLHAFKALQIQSSILLEQNFEKEAGFLLEAALDLL